MKFLAVAIILLGSVCFAQTPIPAGTILPVQLSTTINSRTVRPGKMISARLMQDIELGGGQKLRAGARIEGRIVSSDPHHVTLTFDRAVVRHQTIPIRTDLRAVASMMEVSDAQLPTNDAGGDRGSSIRDWTTAPIGGGVLYDPYGGKLMEGERVIGRSLPGGGIVAIPAAVSGSKCRSDLGDTADQAFWLFAPSACGVYGLGVTIAHAGRTEPVGEIVLQSPTRILIRGGSGLLLRVVPVKSDASSSLSVNK